MATFTSVIPGTGGSTTGASPPTRAPTVRTLLPLLTKQKTAPNVQNKPSENNALSMIPIGPPARSTDGNLSLKNQNTQKNVAVGANRRESRRLSQLPGSIGPGPVGTTILSARRQSLKNKFSVDIPPHFIGFLDKSLEQVQLIESVKTILADEPSRRTDTHLDLVYEWMLQNCKQYQNNIFGSAPEYIRREICRQMRLIRISKLAILIRQGDPGDRCYIVIDGIVDIYIKKDGPIPSIESYENAIAHQTSEGPPYNYTKEFGELRISLGSGAMFGEMIFVNPTARRTATIIVSKYCDECSLIYLERADYIRLVRTASMESSHYTQAEILDQMYLFKDWSKQEKMRLVASMKSFKFRENEYLYRAGEEVTYMYIITSGEVEEKLICRQKMEEQILHKTNTSEAKIIIDLMFISAGDIVGELPFLKNMRTSNIEIRSLTEVNCLAIERRVYESLILNSQSETVFASRKKLDSLSKDREEWRAQRFQFGSSYPSAHIGMSWRLMRMANLKCPRCGIRGHLSMDVSRCSAPERKDLLTTSRNTNGTNSSHKRPSQLHGTGLLLPSLDSSSSSFSSTSTSPNKRKTKERRNKALKELFDENFLPSAKEQLEKCRLACHSSITSTNSNTN